MIHLTTDLKGWTLPIPGPAGELDDAPTPERALHLGLTPGLPILLHDDGTYDEELNAWLHSLPTSGSNSVHTWTAYARDVAMWIRFLAHYKPRTSWMQATLADFQQFRVARVNPRDDVHRKPVSASTWNRQVTALESLYTWAVEAELITKSPFKYKMRVGPKELASGPVESNTLKDTHYKEEKTPRSRYVRHDRFVAFREQGMRCLDGDGGEDVRPNAARHAHRNVVLADFLYLTGLRIQEASSYLEWEMPTEATLATSRSTGALDFLIPLGIGKGKKRRVIMAGPRAFRQVRDYIAVERENLLDRYTNDDGTYERVADPILVQRVDQKYFRVVHTGQLRSVEHTEPEARRRMVEVGPDSRQRPVALWLGDAGQPLDIRSWQDVFKAARGRSGEYVTPHMLRHSYAVNLLSRLVGATMRAVKEDNLTNYGKMVRRLYAEPLNVVRRQLGHASITQTYAYLDCLEEAQQYLNAAVADLDAMSEDIPVEAILDQA